LSYTWLFFHQQRLSDYFLKKTLDNILLEIKKERKNKNLNKIFLEYEREKKREREKKSRQKKREN
jgi:hypothetical protein